MPGHETHDARSPQSHTQAKDSKQAAATGKATEKGGSSEPPGRCRRYFLGDGESAADFILISN
jgi:hypothetical protein